MFWFIIIVIIIPFFVFIKPYNNAQALAQKAKSNYSKIGSGIQKKVQLINQLIDITKGYGELLREFIKTTSNKVGEVTVKGATKLTEVTKKGMEKVGHRDKKTQEITEESLEKVAKEIKEEE